MQHKDRLSDDERNARRLESKRKYREANREKLREAGRAYMAEKREDPEFRAMDHARKVESAYLVQQKAYRAANRKELDAKTREWRESNPDKFSAYQSKYQSEHRKEARKRCVEWRKKYPDRARAQGFKWRSENKEANALKSARRRAKIKHGGCDIPKDIYKRLMSLQKGKCPVCKSQLTTAYRHLDHIIPLARGGEHSVMNVQLLCPPCNLSKNAKHPIDFMRERGFLL